MAKQRRQKEPEIRWPLRCQGCNKVMKRLTNHMKQCPKAKHSHILQKRLREQSKQEAVQLLEHTVVDPKEMKRILNIKSSVERYGAMKAFITSMGHHFKDESASESDNGADQLEQRAKEPLHQTELDQQLENASPPEIHDPHKGKSFEEGSIREKMVMAGLYRQFKLDSAFFIKFRHFKESIQGQREVAGQDLSYCARLLAFIFEKHNKELEAVNKEKWVARLLRKDDIQSFFRKFEECDPSGETVRSLERAVKSLAIYLGTQCDIPEWLCARMDRLEKSIKIRSRGTSKKIRISAHRKKVVKSKQWKVKSMREVRAILDNDWVKRMLEENVAKLEMNARDGDPVDMDVYRFLMHYCICILSLNYGYRPQVAMNMTMDEFKEKLTTEIDGEMVVHFRVIEHKNAPTRGPQTILISKDESKLFRKYRKYGRERLEVPEDVKEFFVGYKSKKRLKNASRLIQEFQSKMLKIEHPVTTNDVRHIIETESRSYLANDPEARLAINDLLSHTAEVAERSYREKQPEHYIRAFSALKHLCEGPKERPVRAKRTETVYKSTPAIGRQTGNGEIQERGTDEEIKQTLIRKYNITVNSEIPTKEQLKRADGARDQAEAKNFYNKLYHYRNSLRIKVITQAMASKFKQVDESNQKAIEQEFNRQLEVNEWGSIPFSRFSAELKRAIRAYLRAQHQEQLELELMEQEPDEPVDEEMEEPDEPVGEEMEEPDEPVGEVMEELDEPVGEEIEELMEEEREVQFAQASSGPSHPKKVNYTDGEILEKINTQDWLWLEKLENPLVNGLGVYATREIAKGQVICDYRGQKTTLEKHQAKLNELDPELRNTVEMYAFEMKGKEGRIYVIEGHVDDGSFGRLINHSRIHPNCAPERKILKSSSGREHYKIIFRTKRDIIQGEELLWNYGQYYQDQPWYNNCTCLRCND